MKRPARAAAGESLQFIDSLCGPRVRGTTSLTAASHMLSKTKQVARQLSTTRNGRQLQRSEWAQHCRPVSQPAHPDCSHDTARSAHDSDSLDSLWMITPTTSSHIFAAFSASKEGSDPSDKTGTRAVNGPLQPLLPIPHHQLVLRPNPSAPPIPLLIPFPSFKTTARLTCCPRPGLSSSIGCFSSFLRLWSRSC